MSDRLGFIGLGVMGRPMARNLLRAGYELTVLDINQDAVNDLVAQGAQARGSPAALASQSDIVIMMLPDTPQVAEVVLGKDGVLAGAPRGMLLIDMSRSEERRVGKE